MSNLPDSLADDGLRLRLHGATAVLTLNRPATRNAMTRAMWAVLPDLMAQLANSDQVKAVLLTGAGGVFCAGADVSEFPATFVDAGSSAVYNDLVEAGRVAISRQPKPTIAAVSGLAIGGGCGLAAACDLRFADNGARFAMPPARIGAAYRFGGVRDLVDLIGPARTKDMLYSGRMVDAEEAQQIGLIDRVFAGEDLLDEALRYCNGMASLSTNTQRITKQMIRAISDGTEAETDELRKLFADSFASDDFAEGYRAFLEKRKPVFR